MPSLNPICEVSPGTLGLLTCAVSSLAFITQEPLDYEYASKMYSV